MSQDSDAIRMFRMMLTEGRSLIRQRNAIEERTVELLSDQPDNQLLRTIPGIGPINALTILAETGDLRRFRHHRQFLKFCGMDLATVQSGMFRIPISARMSSLEFLRPPDDLGIDSTGVPVLPQVVRPGIVGKVHDSLLQLVVAVTLPAIGTQP